MYKIRQVLKTLFTPVTIMLIPHNSKKTINIKLPSIGVITSLILWLVGSIYVVSIAVDTVRYYDMESKLKSYTAQFDELTSAISTIKKAEMELRRILSLGSKEKILENVDSSVNMSDAGSLDINLLKDQIKNTVERVEAIQDFLRQQKDIYMATPKGLPLIGRITSHFGERKNPIHGEDEFHSGVDISANPKTPIKATADGVVSFSGWSGGSGRLVVIEHGFGYSTFYAHNKLNAVKVGQKVKRGDIIAYVGSTGNATGPHLHYEVWHNGRSINPMKFIKEAKNVFKEKR